MFERSQRLREGISLGIDRETLRQFGGITGLGWTTSGLGYASTVLGYGSEYAMRLVAEPQSFLYAGAVLFCATLGLDRLAQALPSE